MAWLMEIGIMSKRTAPKKPTAPNQRGFWDSLGTFFGWSR